MSIDLKDKCVLVYDYGNYISVAQRLSRDFGKVYYFCPYIINGYPENSPLDIGRNVEGIERVKEWAEIIWEVDLVFFPDCYDAFLQEYFKSIGKLVYGSGHSAKLEYERKESKQILKDLGLPVGTYYTVQGVHELEEFLKNSKNLFIKSSLRGCMETWFHNNYALSRIELKRMKHDMGVYDKQEIYLLEEKLNAIAEIGYDGFCIDGKYPEISMSGIELKDTGYFGAFIPYKELPKQLTDITDKFADIFNELKYRGTISNEVIITKDKRGFLIDWTLRCPSPNTFLALEAYTNYPQMVWQIASGQVPTIEFKYKYGVELIIKSESAQDQPSALQVPSEYKDYVKIKNLVIDDDGTYYYIPNNIKMKEIGSVIGLGNTKQEAIDMAKKVANSIQGFDIQINSDCLGKAQEQIAALKKVGIDYLS